MLCTYLGQVWIALIVTHCVFLQVPTCRYIELRVHVELHVHILPN
jgi:hypothetical protein